MNRIPTFYYDDVRPPTTEEYMLIHPAEGSYVAGLADIEKSYVDLLFALAASTAAAE